MGKLNITENLFLEKQELNRMVLLLKEQGYEFYNNLFVDSYGIVPTSKDDPGTQFEVSDSGVANQITIQPGVAIDKDMNIIRLNSAVNITLPASGGVYRYIKIAYATSNLEEGTVSVDSSGNLVGIGTEFTKILRGQPNFPVKVRFWDGSAWLTPTYEVLRVVDDNNAILQGDFTVTIPAGTQFAVWGSFSADFTPLAADAMIYQYDHVEISYNTSASTTPPALTTDEEFYLSRVQNIANDSIDVQLDLRSGYLFYLRAMFNDDGYHYEDYINIFNKISNYNVNLTPISATLNVNDDKIVQLGDSDDAVAAVSFTAVAGSIDRICGFERASDNPYAVGDVLKLIRADASGTVYLEKPTTVNTVSQGIYDYSWVLRTNLSSYVQLTDRQWKYSELIELQCTAVAWDSTDSVWRSAWKLISNIEGDTYPVRALQDDFGDYQDTAVFENGVGGITDTASADTAGARTGSIYIA